MKSIRWLARTRHQFLSIGAALLLMTAHDAAFSQQAVTLTLTLQSTVAGQVGSLVLSGQSFGSGIPLDPGSSDAAVADVGRFHSATLANDRAGAMNAICPDDQAQYADLVETDDDAQIASAFLQPFTSRKALLEVQFGSYTILFTVLSGQSVDPLVRNYVLKTVNGSKCMTFDLRSDETFNFAVGLLTTSLGG